MSYDPAVVIKDLLVVEQGEFNQLLELFRRSVSHKLVNSAISEFSELNNLIGRFEAYTMFVSEDWFLKFMRNADEALVKCKEDLKEIIK